MYRHVSFLQEGARWAGSTFYLGRGGGQFVGVESFLFFLIFRSGSNRTIEELSCCMTSVDGGYFMGQRVLDACISSCG